MTCGRCASKVNIVLIRVDPACEIRVDMPQHELRVRSDEDRAARVEAFSEAGYPPA